jgi:hypothetical protein
MKQAQTYISTKEETLRIEWGKRAKTIDSRYSLVVTHPTTNRPAHGLSMTERTGSPVFHVLWSIAENSVLSMYINLFDSDEVMNASICERPTMGIIH